VTCPSCAAENPDTARFCGHCGESLITAAPCPRCATENPSDQRFCHGCGLKLTGDEQAEEAAAHDVDVAQPGSPPLGARRVASAQALAGERKQITVLFCDVERSMELAESVGPETWREVMARFYDRVTEVVVRFEGTVDKFTGDGAMALFGAPLAHEDHARRACYAALELRDAVADYGRELRRDHGLSFSIRMGLNSGEVVVGGIGADETLDYTAIGNTVGLAARMEALAESGRPYLTAETAIQVQGFFELDELGKLKVKGVPEPVRAFALVAATAARTRLEASAARGLSPFLGRERELELLEQALGNTEHGGRAVGIVAEPGVGKSRLCHEFAERCHNRGLDVTVGSGVAHGRHVPLVPVLDMLRSYFRIAESDDGRAAREKIAGRLLLLDEGFRDSLPLLFDFLGVTDPDDPPTPMNPETRQRAIFAALRRLVHARAREGPSVVIVEDLQWLDPGSEAFLANLADSLSGSRTLLVVNFRPEYRGEWLHRSSYEQLALRVLGPEEARTLAGELLGSDPSLDGLPELVAERTGGNPFYVEEVVRSLLEDGSLAGERGAHRLVRSVESLEIPATVQAVLAARIDRLDETEKATLQAAAVIGNEFTEPVLTKVVGLTQEQLFSALRNLCRAELLHERTLYPTAEYAFSHPLTEEVAYRSQLGNQRAAAHAAVADALESLEPDRLDELSALIASHCERAGQLEAAIPWHARAAGWAGQSHPADALRHWRRVRELSAELPKDEGVAGTLVGACLWILQWGWRLGISEEEIAAVYEQARALVRASGPAAMAAVIAAYGIARGMRGDVQEALELSGEAKRLADDSGATELMVATGHSYWLEVAGRLEEALAIHDDHIERFGDRLELGRAILGFSGTIWVRWYRGVILAELGRLDEAQPEFEWGIAAAREHDDIENLGWAHGAFAVLDYYRGSPAEGLAHAHEGVAIAQRIGSSFSWVTAHNWLAVAHLAREEWPEAIAAATEALSRVSETNTAGQYVAFMQAGLAHAHLGAGDVGEAVTIASEGADGAEARKLRAHEAWCRLVLGRALVAAGRCEGAQTQLHRSLALSEPGGLWVVPHVHVALLELAVARSDAELADRALASARSGFQAQGADGHLRRLEAQMSSTPQTAPR
jgi:class 3 adenylate cyclase/tetratricopeptide (TPR) repeat protein